jgi:hypothetical protein
VLCHKMNETQQSTIFHRASSSNSAADAVTIRKTKFVGGTKLQNLGDVTIQMKIHKKCRCQCMKTANDCNFLQRYIPGQCRCECTNLKESEECTKVSKQSLDDESGKFPSQALIVQIFLLLIISPL